MLSQKTGCLFLLTLVFCIVLPKNVFGSISRMGESRKTPPEFPQRSNNNADTQGSKAEPTCAELRQMWKSAKRQSRAAEMTNEIPTFRDPFTYNIWEPYYPSTRSNVGIRNLRFRDYSRPVYGRVIHKVPMTRVMDIPKRTRAFEAVARYGALHRVQDPPRRRVSTFRLPGGGSAQSPPQNAITPQYGTFQRLKELIRTERTRELQEQRMAEEMAARAAAIKEIANGQGFASQSNYNPDAVPVYEEEEEEPPQSQSQMHQNQEPYRGDLIDMGSDLRHSSQMFSFPNLLAPSLGNHELAPPGYDQQMSYYKPGRAAYYGYSDYDSKYGLE